MKKEEKSELSSMDINKDLELSDYWSTGKNDRDMCLYTLARIVKQGFNTCENECLSRDVCGSDSCRCVRSIFPTPQHYKLYGLLREKYEEREMLKIFSKANEEINGH